MSETVERPIPAIKSIVTNFINPPIPQRGHDWCAFYDGEEEAGNYGYGETEQRAVDDLKANYTGREGSK